MEKESKVKLLIDLIIPFGYLQLQSCIQHCLEIVAIKIPFLLFMQMLCISKIHICILIVRWKMTFKVFTPYNLQKWTIRHKQ